MHIHPEITKLATQSSIMDTDLFGNSSTLVSAVSGMGNDSQITGSERVGGMSTTELGQESATKESMVPSFTKNKRKPRPWKPPGRFNRLLDALGFNQEQRAKENAAAIKIQCMIRKRQAQQKVKLLIQRRYLKLYDVETNEYVYKDKFTRFVFDRKPFIFPEHEDLPTPRPLEAPLEYDPDYDDLDRDGFAVVVTVNSFVNSDRIPDLPADTTREHDRLLDVLSHDYLCKFAPNRVIGLLNPTLADFKDSFETARKQCRRQDFLLVYICTHIGMAFKGETNNKKETGYILLHDSEWTQPSEIAATSVSLTSFAAILNGILCTEKTILLNCAHTEKPPYRFFATKELYPPSNCFTRIADEAHCTVIGNCAINEVVTDVICHVPLPRVVAKEMPAPSFQELLLAGSKVAVAKDQVEAAKAVKAAAEGERAEVAEGGEGEHPPGTDKGSLPPLPGGTLTAPGTATGGRKNNASRGASRGTRRKNRNKPAADGPPDAANPHLQAGAAGAAGADVGRTDAPPSAGGGNVLAGGNGGPAGKPESNDAANASGGAQGVQVAQGAQGAGYENSPAHLKSSIDSVQGHPTAPDDPSTTPAGAGAGISADAPADAPAGAPAPPATASVPPLILATAQPGTSLATATASATASAPPVPVSSEVIIDGVVMVPSLLRPEVLVPKKYKTRKLPKVTPKSDHLNADFLTAITPDVTADLFARLLGEWGVTVKDPLKPSLCPEVPTVTWKKDAETNYNFQFTIPTEVNRIRHERDALLWNVRRALGPPANYVRQVHREREDQQRRAPAQVGLLNEAGTLFGSAVIHALAGDAVAADCLLVTTEMLFLSIYRHVKHALATTKTFPAAVQLTGGGALTKKSPQKKKGKKKKGKKKKKKKEKKKPKPKSDEDEEEEEVPEEDDEDQEDHEGSQASLEKSIESVDEEEEAPVVAEVVEYRISPILVIPRSRGDVELPSHRHPPTLMEGGTTVVTCLPSIPPTDGTHSVYAHPTPKLFLPPSTGVVRVPPSEVEAAVGVVQSPPQAPPQAQAQAQSQAQSRPQLQIQPQVQAQSHPQQQLQTGNVSTSAAVAATATATATATVAVDAAAAAAVATRTPNSSHLVLNTVCLRCSPPPAPYAPTVREH